MDTKITVNYLGDIAIQIIVTDHQSDLETLERVFGMFNHGSGQEHPAFLERKTRSLSVNDTVRVGEQWYQCESFGWKKITEQEVDELEKLVVGHPSFENEGPWYALSQVMWDLFKAKEKASKAMKLSGLS